MSSDSQPDTWTLTEARAKFGEVIARAQHFGPQVITRHGKRAVALVDCFMGPRIAASGVRQLRRLSAQFALASIRPGGHPFDRWAPRGRPLKELLIGSYHGKDLGA